MKVQRVKILGIEDMPSLSQARLEFLDQMSANSKGSAGDASGGTGSSSRRRSSRRRRSNQKLKLRDVTMDISAKTEKILREQDEERTDMLAFYMGETSITDIGLNLDNAEDVNKWKGSKKKDSVRRTKVQSVAEKIEKQEDERDELMKYYMGETDAWEIGLSLDEVGAINAWRGLGEKKRKPKPSELADYIVRHEDDSDREDKVRYFLGEIDLSDLGITESDITGETMAKVVVETCDDNPDQEADVGDKELIDIENMIMDEIDDLIGKDWRGGSATESDFQSSVSSIC